jgi:LmbE family N-acetylglucosaminyl deacetylase
MSKVKTTDRVLVLAPHIDDGELGCGGSISKFIEEGKEVYYAAFSAAEKSVPAGYPPDTLKKELARASEALGIPKSNVILHGYDVRNFSYHRQDILESLVKLRKDLQPTLVFMPSVNDLHQDHTVIAEEAMRAYKKDTILGYEMPWNNITFNTVCFIPLEERHIEKKIAALRCYDTQKHRTYLSPEFVRSLAITRGTQIDRKFAEVFEVLRWIMD